MRRACPHASCVVLSMHEFPTDGKALPRIQRTETRIRGPALLSVGSFSVCIGWLQFERNRSMPLADRAL